MMTENMIPQEKAKFPFNMIESMMPWYPWISVMGWMIVLISFLVGLFVLSPAVQAFFSDAKVVREAAGAGSAFVVANVAAHVVETWVPIAKRLREMGFVIVNNITVSLRPALPSIPKRVRAFQLIALMGVMVLMIALIVGIVLALTVVPSYWNNSIANDLNPAQPGSALLGQLSIIASYTFWLNPLRMIGMAFLFSGITVALTVILNTLRVQSKSLVGFYEKVTG
jgi:Fe2+ transport system protein FeoA